MAKVKIKWDGRTRLPQRDALQTFYKNSDLWSKFRGGEPVEVYEIDWGLLQYAGCSQVDDEPHLEPEPDVPIETKRSRRTKTL